MIFSLRYEDDRQKIVDLKNLMIEKGIHYDNLQNLEYLKEFGGKSKRSEDLFSKQTWLMKIASDTIKSVMKNIPNIYTQHTSQYLSFVDKLITKKLPEEKFPSIQIFKEINNNSVIVFIVGGMTYEEIKDAHFFSLNKDNNVMIGSNTVINSKMFMADLLVNSSMKVQNINNPYHDAREYV